MAIIRERYILELLNAMKENSSHFGFSLESRRVVQAELNL